MTKVEPYTPKQIPIVSINDQVTDSSESFRAMDTHDEASSSNVHRRMDQKNFCEFKSKICEEFRQAKMYCI